MPYELCLTIDSGEVNPLLDRHVKSAGVDLGAVNIAACATDKGVGINLSGRYLRSIKRLRNKRHSTISARLSKYSEGSRRHKKPLKAKARASATFYRQSRDVLHKASRKLINFTNEQIGAHIAFGDVRDIADGTNKGKHQDQRLSQWAHGRFVEYSEYKARTFGISVDQIPEDYSTRTCSVCKQVKSSAPWGRVFTCSGCGSIIPRDGNWAENICSRYRYGEYGSVQVQSFMYLRPIAVVHRKRADVAGAVPLVGCAGSHPL